MNRPIPARRHVSYDCGGSRVIATLDHGTKSVGLIIVSGGNEPRNGAFNFQSRLARAVSLAGFPVLRFDRRGVGDSEGDNQGYLNSADDIASAAECLRREYPQINSLLAYGNCDAATGLVLHSTAPFSALVLSNPWLFDTQDGRQLPSPAAVRERYKSKLRQPSEWRRIFTGGVSFRKLRAGLLHALRPVESSSNAARFRQSLTDCAKPTCILLADKDRTAQHCLAQLGDMPKGSSIALETCSGADHAFSAPEHQLWLEERLLRALFDEEARQFHMGGPAELADRA